MATEGRRPTGILDERATARGDAGSAPFPILIWREMRRLAVLGFPIVVALVATMLIGVVDTIMIAPLGTVPLAAASVTMSVLMILYSGLYGLVSIIGVRMAAAARMGCRWPRGPVSSSRRFPVSRGRR